MKNTNKRININDKAMRQRIWHSTVVRYLVKDIETINEDIEYINELRMRCIGSDHFGFHLREYLINRLEYSNTLEGDEQVNELVLIYILLKIFNTKTGKYEAIINLLKESVVEEGIIRMEFMYLKRTVEFIELGTADTVLSHYTADNNESGYRIILTKSMKLISSQMIDIITQCNKEVENIKHQSHTCHEFGDAYRNYLKNRIEYVKLVEPQSALYHILWLEVLTRSLDAYHFGRYYKEVALYKQKMYSARISLIQKISKTQDID